MNKGSIELDQNGCITGVSSFAWNSLNINPNLIIGEQIQSYIEQVKASWATISKGTLVSHPFEFKNENHRYNMNGIIMPVLDKEKKIKKFRFLLYNINPKKA